MDAIPGWVDITLLSVLAVSALVGLFRGLVFEVLSVLGWVVAWFAARWGAPQLAPHLPLGEPPSALNLGAAFACVFIAALVIWGLLSRLVRMLVRATPLAPIDRVLGAGFGLLRGLLLLLAVAVVVALTPLQRSTAWQRSVGAGWLQAAMQGLKPVLPPSVTQHLPV